MTDLFICIAVSIGAITATSAFAFCLLYEAENHGENFRTFIKNLFKK